MQNNKSSLLKDTKQNINIRIKTYLSFVFTILFIGTPIWLLTTSIYRAVLPIDQISKYNFQNLLTHNNISINIPIYINLPSSDMDSLLSNSQTIINNDLASLIKNSQLTNPNHIYNHLNWSITLKNLKSQHPIPQIDKKNNYILNLKYTDANESYFISPFSKESTIYYTDNIVATNYVADFISKFILNHLLESEIDYYFPQKKQDDQKQDTIAIHAPNYHLSFSLLYGDGDDLNWDIQNAFDTYLKPLFNHLSSFTNLTVNSQIQFYSQLSFEPTFDLSKNAYILKQSDIATFINHDDWNLDNSLISSNSQSHTSFINLILYIPSKTYSPLLIQNSTSNSFIIPQYGAVKILNWNTTQNGPNLSKLDLLPVMEIFTSHIITLFGLPKLPKSPYIRFDILTRFLSIQNIFKSINNLSSLMNLSQSLKNIAIPDKTLYHVQQTLNLIDKTISYLNNGNWSIGCKTSNEALVQSDSAFFEKEMVQQVYFPEEHKFAVYSPLLGPALTILFIGLIRVLQDFR
ncbi:PIG-S family GPI transamidase component ASCRUDRAFT_83796 [Ascoidea rubescens DSM 1968]|uniref:GPI transamidase component PIG-S n=1 Tax=Ascoidea rubescens DSM 1968 TaxID=1344418 RepID=A0A1D2VQM5_9ASCO|nr:hypothetical protein ASCRUDRAFT_83796 [Ascoidea rubescens DSM 1968]ODV63899.1 hypothetical protein ASCRUDRAFT_83796 [Ascoidea rubescens DSM 1968]